MLKSLLPKVIFYTFLTVFSSLLFLIFLVFNITKDFFIRLANDPHDDGRNNYSPTNIFGENIEDSRLKYMQLEDELFDKYHK